MATYGQNTTIKVNAAIAATSPMNPSNHLLYTCPANSYAIVQVASTSGVTAYVGGVQANNGFNISIQLYIGPGQQLTVTGSGGSIITVSGVEFINTP